MSIDLLNRWPFLPIVREDTENQLATGLLTFVRRWPMQLQLLMLKRDDSVRCSTCLSQWNTDLFQNQLIVLVLFEGHLNRHSDQTSDIDAEHLRHQWERCTKWRRSPKHRPFSHHTVDRVRFLVKHRHVNHSRFYWDILYIWEHLWRNRNRTISYYLDRTHRSVARQDCAYHAYRAEDSLTSNHDEPLLVHADISQHHIVDATTGCAFVLESPRPVGRMWEDHLAKRIPISRPTHRY